ncbi:hypothetical protein GE21DRAFT_8455 [Neurospora crassa]|uniref:Uncharacterized protein n=1 Tax=Neurospora crassa (strain ATCC 24698 / 74-OR23-1A / CBS 708.71 / DSM 1257 / FGSC 987) TaxID=367110 RepID=Q7RZ02_NEUCR|nr:hypothetical protein NCU07227 [Neurospora crassa OR74A]EAA28216.1 hypothetical protein NCU07227 [Neurospora crassa OR74A]KHE85742.1 hypothetical protein GE21DRAFT_8455 [Neurospora crassa]|eukprot:XP_957452.1 hypothetical protein NCU07227 [Neurospora crassa OR74A]
MQQPIELDEDHALRELELKWSFQKGLDSSPLCLLRLRTRLPSRRTSTAALQRHSNGRPGPPPEKHDDKMLKSQGLAQQRPNSTIRTDVRPLLMTTCTTQYMEQISSPPKDWPTTTQPDRMTWHECALGMANLWHSANLNAKGWLEGVTVSAARLGSWSMDCTINGRVLSKNSVYYDREAEVSSSKSTDAGTSTEASSST